MGTDGEWGSQKTELFNVSEITSQSYGSKRPNNFVLGFRIVFLVVV